MTLPNLVTVVRLLFVPLLIYVLLTPNIPGQPYTAGALFLVLAASDALDGILARRLQQESDLGKLIDPLADKVLVFSTFLVLIELGTVPAIPVIIMLVREFAVVGLRTFVATKGQIVAASMLAKWKTGLQIVAIFWILLGWPQAMEMLWLATAVSVVSGAAYFKTVRMPGRAK